MQYNTRAVSHVTSKNRSTKPMMAIALAHASTMLTEVLKCSSSLLLMVLVSCWMTWQNKNQALFNNYSSRPHGLWVNSPWGRKPIRDRGIIVKYIYKYMYNYVHVRGFKSRSRQILEFHLCSFTCTSIYLYYEGRLTLSKYRWERKNILFYSSLVVPVFIELWRESLVTDACDRLYIHIHV